MAYDPSLYNPYYGLHTQPQFQQAFQQQQPVNGIMFIDIDNLDSYWMPPGSVSQPLFVDDEHFVIKTFDKNGGSATEAYLAKKIPLSSLLKSNDMNVTKEDFEAFKAEVMEAINGRNTIADVQQATGQQSTANAADDAGARK